MMNNNYDEEMEYRESEGAIINERDLNVIVRRNANGLLEEVNIPDDIEDTEDMEDIKGE